MRDNEDVADLRKALEGLFDALLTLRAEMDHRDRRMSADFGQKMASVQNQIAQTERKLESIADGAGAKIERHARDAVMPVAAEYGRSIEALSGKLHGIEKLVWVWGGAAFAVLALVVAGLWWTLTGYKRDLDTAKTEYARYEKANAVLQAYSASDAFVCDGRLCVNVDPKGVRQGDKGQYRQARMRAQQ
jgi:hypothetical protein